MQQDWTKAKELYARAVKLSSSDAHYPLGSIYDESERGDLKKAKIHYEEAAIAGHKTARYNIGTMDYKSGNLEQALKNWKIAASAGDYTAMHNMTIKFEDDAVSRESIESTLMAYNSICAKMRSEARG